MFIDLFQNIDSIENNPEDFISFSQFGTMFALIILMSLVSLAALILFIIHVVKNKSLPETEKIIWVLVFVFAGVIGFPLYWFMRGIKYNEASYLPTQQVVS